MRVISFVPAVIWLIISIILLTLPANDLPHNGLFDLPYFDKLVHFGMFFLLTASFCFPFFRLNANYSIILSTFIRVVFWVILYGILMEFVQKFFTDGRSFDVVDIVFDTVGSVAGFLAAKQTLKKIGPNKNRGRNQN